MSDIVPVTGQTILVDSPLFQADPLPVALQGTQRKLCKLVAKQRTNFLRNIYEIGRIAQEGLDAYEATHSHYGMGLVDQLAEEVGLSARTLRYSLKLVETFSPKEFADLISNPKISWSHVIQLMSIEPPERRQQLLDRTIQESWSSDDLNAAILIAYGRRQSSGGRKPAVPKNLNQALSRISKAAQKFRNAMELSWFGDAFDVPSTICDTPPEEITATLKERTAECATLLEAIAERARENATRLRAPLPWIEEVLACQVENPQGRAE
jgi:hypothetical protein